MKYRKKESGGLYLLGIVCTLITLWWGFDRTYARNSVVEANKTQTIQTFDMMQKQITTAVSEMERKNRIADLNRQLTYLTEHKYELKASLRKYSDPEIQEELNYIQKKLEKVKDALDKLLIGQ